MCSLPRASRTRRKAGGRATYPDPRLKAFPERGEAFPGLSRKYPTPGPAAR
jgi:hypothetical protein